MKRIVYFALLFTLCSLPLAPVASAVGTVTQAWTYPTSKSKVLTMTWTADAAAATVPDTVTSDNIDGYIIRVVTDPGATAPTDNYDITLTDANGVDVMGGTLADRDTANTEQTFPVLDSGTGATGPAFVAGTLTLTITNNAVNAATGAVIIYIRK